MTERIFDLPRTTQPSDENALNCSQSQKVITNSVYCDLLDQWISTAYCQNMCGNYTLREKKLQSQPQQNSIEETTEEIPEAKETGYIPL